MSGFFYNPNIHPLLEYRRRVTGVRDLSDLTGLPLSIDLSYDPGEWFALVAAGDGSRCARCIGQRLDRAAEEAVAQGCEAFSTTLSISPWQDHAAIQDEGTKAAEHRGIEFLYEDLRPLYGESKRLSRRMGLYRQKYCGCLLSEWERFREA